MDVNEILTIENGTLKAIAGQKYEELILPETIQSIDNGVFDSVKIKKLVLPSSLEEITTENFKDAVNICEIVVSEGTEIIDDEAFMNCTSLEKITLPSSADEIGQGILNGCKKLSEAVIHTTAFFYNYEQGKEEIPTSIKSIVLPEDGEVELMYAEYCFPELEEITFPQGYSLILDDYGFICCKLHTLHFIANGKKYSVKLPAYEDVFENEDEDGYLNGWELPLDVKQYNKFYGVINKSICWLNDSGDFDEFGFIPYSNGYEMCDVRSSLLDLQFAIMEIRADVYGTDIIESGKSELYYLKNSCPLFEQAVLKFFPKHPEYLPCLDDYPNLKKEVLKKMGK